MSIKSMMRRAEDEISSMLATGRRYSESDGMAIRAIGNVGSVVNAGSPQSASSMLAGIGRWGNFGVDIGRHLEQYRHYAGRVFSLIRLISNRIAAQPLHHARRVGSKQEIKSLPFSRKAAKNAVPSFLKNNHESLEVYQDSAILAAFRDPNPIMVRHTLMTNTVATFELTGKSHWWIRSAEETEEGKPEIWPIPSHWIAPIHNEKRLFDKWEVRPNGSGEKFTLDRDDIVYFYQPDPSDPLGAYSSISALAKTVMNDEAIEETQRRAFLNAIAPSVAIMIGQRPEDSGAGVAGKEAPILTRAQRKALKTVLLEEYRGTLNNGMPLIMDGFIRDIKVINQPPKEFDFLNSGNATKARLDQGYGVNPISMGEVEGANRASSAVAEDHLCANVINPRLELFSEVATKSVPRKLTGREDEGLYWEPAKSHDPELELADDQAALDRAAMSRNEFRAKRGMVRISGGDSVFIGGQMIPIVPEPEVDPDEEADRLPEAGPKCPRGTIAAVLGVKATADYHDSERLKFEAALTDALVEAFQGLSSGLREQIDRINKAALTPSVASSVIDRAHWERVIRDVSMPIIRNAVVAGAAGEWNLSKSQGSLRTKNVAMPESVNKKIRKTIEQTQDSPIWMRIVQSVVNTVKRTAREAIASGANVALAVTMAVASPESILDRSAGIAAVETQAAYSAGQTHAYAALVAAGRVRRRMWLSRRDAKVRETHIEADGQIVVGNNPFTVGGHKADYPCDPKLPAKERCNCRCVVVTVD